MSWFKSSHKAESKLTQVLHVQLEEFPVRKVSKPPLHLFNYIGDKMYPLGKLQLDVEYKHKVISITIIVVRLVTVLHC